MAEGGKGSCTGRIVVLGSGTSEGVPVASCLTKLEVTCPACSSASSSTKSKDRRRNTGLALCFPVPKGLFKEQWKEIRAASGHGQAEDIAEQDGLFVDRRAAYMPLDRPQPSMGCSCATQASDPARAASDSTPTPDTVEDCTVFVDVGKFFWQSALDILPAAAVRHMDAVLLTHDHFDAIGGFDDLRDWTKRVQEHTVPVILTEKSLGVVGNMFPYLVNANQAAGGGVSDLVFLPRVRRHVTGSLFGLPFIPLPVMHGRRYASLGYRFGDVSYISDCSFIPDTTTEIVCGCRMGPSAAPVICTEVNNAFRSTPGHEYRQQIVSGRCQCPNCLPPDMDAHLSLVDSLGCSRVLILDCLSAWAEAPNHPSHFLLRDALTYLRTLPVQPETVYFTGMTHGVLHARDEALLAKIGKQEGMHLHFLYDGMEIPFSFTPVQ